MFRCSELVTRPMKVILRSSTTATDNFTPDLLSLKWGKADTKDVGSHTRACLQSPFHKILDLKGLVRNACEHKTGYDLEEFESNHILVDVAPSMERLVGVVNALEEFIHHLEEYAGRVGSESGHAIAEILKAFDSISLERLLDMDDDDPLLEDILSAANIELPPDSDDSSTSVAKVAGVNDIEDERSPEGVHGDDGTADASPCTSTTVVTVLWTRVQIS